MLRRAERMVFLTFPVLMLVSLPFAIAACYGRNQWNTIFRTIIVSNHTICHHGVDASADNSWRIMFTLVEIPRLARQWHVFVLELLYKCIFQANLPFKQIKVS